MKKIFGFMIGMGIILAFITAGGMDAGSITTDRILVQAAVASLLVFSGTHLMARGEAA